MSDREYQEMLARYDALTESGSDPGERDRLWAIITGRLETRPEGDHDGHS